VREMAPSLILRDKRIPVLNGWEAARRYRAGPDPPAPIWAPSPP